MEKIFLISAFALIFVHSVTAQVKENPDKRSGIPEPSFRQDSAKVKNAPDSISGKHPYPVIRLPGIIPGNRPVNRFYAQRFEPRESRFIVKPDTSVRYFLIIKEPPEMGSYK